ncbi:MAG: hypothetical protein WBB83_09470 [Candidatus Microthrix parvicella]
MGGFMLRATFSVSLVLENFEFTDGNLDRVFEVLPDAVPSSIGGLTSLATPVEAADAEAAAFLLVELVGEIFPDAMAVRLDQDLVAISDIAARTERSRESVRLLVEGKRGPGGFPAPVGTVGDGIRVWPWASILGWFRDALGEDLGEHAVPPEVAAVVDAHLASRNQRLPRGYGGSLDPVMTSSEPPRAGAA